MAKTYNIEHQNHRDDSYVKEVSATIAVADNRYFFRVRAYHNFNDTSSDGTVGFEASGPVPINDGLPGKGQVRADIKLGNRLDESLYDKKSQEKISIRGLEGELTATDIEVLKKVEPAIGDSVQANQDFIFQNVLRPHYMSNSDLIPHLIERAYEEQERE